MTDEECTLRSVPPLSDVRIMLEIIESLGRKFIFDEKAEEVTVLPGKIASFEEDYELAGKMRASFLVMGPLLARLKRATVPLPGGCAIGSRPVDLHLKGFMALGARIKLEFGFINIKAKKLIGNKIYLDFPSVGATENLLMAAVMAEGETVIENAAEEPEVMDLAEFLIKMGARIEGAGTGRIFVSGVKKLSAPTTGSSPTG